MSSSFLLTEEDIVIQDLYIEHGRLKYKQYGISYNVDTLDDIPVYENFKVGSFSTQTLREVANAELERITQKLIDLSVTFCGEKQCAIHTGMFSGTTRVDAGRGVLVRLTQPKQIKGRIGGSDDEYPGCVLVASKPTHHKTTLQPHVNYIIHGDDSGPEYSINWVKILRDKNAFSRLTGLEAPVDVEVGRQLMFVDGKYKRQIDRGCMESPETSTRVRLVDVPEDWETITVSSPDVFRNYSSSKMVVKAIKLCNRLGQSLEINRIVDISRQTIENVIAVIARCPSHLVGDIAVNGFMLGIRGGVGATNFKELTEVTFGQLRFTMVRLHDSDRLYIHRTMGTIEVQGDGETRHIGSGSGAMARYEGKVKWAG